jgi:hypothetical protein
MLKLSFIINISSFSPAKIYRLQQQTLMESDRLMIHNHFSLFHSEKNKVNQCKLLP